MPKQQEPNWGNAVLMGFEVALGVALGLAVGLWLDKRFQTGGKATLIGVLVGLGGGLYLLIKEALRMNKD